MTFNCYQIEHSIQLKAATNRQSNLSSRYKVQQKQKQMCSVALIDQLGIGLVVCIALGEKFDQAGHSISS
jgi:hypothetical protein